MFIYHILIIHVPNVTYDDKLYTCVILINRDKTIIPYQYPKLYKHEYH